MPCKIQRPSNILQVSPIYLPEQYSYDGDKDRNESIIVIVEQLAGSPLHNLSIGRKP